LWVLKQGLVDEFLNEGSTTRVSENHTEDNEGRDDDPNPLDNAFGALGKKNAHIIFSARIVAHV